MGKVKRRMNTCGIKYGIGKGQHRHHYVIGILLQIQRKIKLIDNWSNKTDKLRHRIQRTAGEAQQVKHSR